MPSHTAAGNSPAFILPIGAVYTVYLGRNLNTDIRFKERFFIDCAVEIP
jgi:hypothetical protein